LLSHKQCNWDRLDLRDINFRRRGSAVNFEIGFLAVVELFEFTRVVLLSIVRDLFPRNGIRGLGK